MWPLGDTSSLHPTHDDLQVDGVGRTVCAFWIVPPAPRLPSPPARLWWPPTTRQGPGLGVGQWRDRGPSRTPRAPAG